MLSIKLKMIGKKGQRSFRIIVQEARSKLRGKFIEDLGWYNPHSNKFEIKKDRVLYWLKVGAQPTETVSQLLRKNQVEQPQEKTVQAEPEA
ncbi:MAG: 30S ribosomal protein S16 [Candidatus Colwellbacteria bacterium]|nr:30S ribosomal protein S16 [Candidatus Colwellbacteria bacterium]